MSNPHAINIYTDGSTLKNPGGISGQGIVVIYPDDDIVELSPGGYKQSTNNRSELRAVIEALQYIQTQEKARVTNMICIHSDSQYVVDSFPKAIGGYWNTVGWLTKDGHDVDNQDLWKTLIREHKKTRKRVEILKVKGHSGNEYNEKADRLADISRENAEKTDPQLKRTIVRRWLDIAINKRGMEFETSFTAFVQRTDPRQSKFSAFVQILSPNEYRGCRVEVIGNLNTHLIKAGHIYEFTLIPSGKQVLIHHVSQDMGNPSENQTLISG